MTERFCDGCGALLASDTSLDVEVSQGHGEDLANGGWVGGTVDVVASVCGDFCSVCASAIIDPLRLDARKEFFGRHTE